MNPAQIGTTNALGAILAVIAGHPLLERLFFASLELAVLAVLVYAAIRLGRIRSARLASILWLLVLAKSLVSLAIGSPIPLVRMHVPEVAVVVPVPQPKVAPVAEPPAVETAKPEHSQPLADNSDESILDAEMRPQLSAEVPTPRSTLEATTPQAATPEPIVAETPPVTAPQPVFVPANVATILLAVWLCGVFLFALRSLINRVRVWRLVRGARIPDAGLLARSNSVATSLGLKRPVPVRVTTDLEGPALVGSLFATVLIPDWLAADPNPARLDWALRHEIMHWKLRDPLAGLVREFAQMLFYFHPVAWWAGHRWEVAAEQACDRAIVTNAADSADYAEQLYGILVGMQGRLRARIGNGLFATRTQIGQRIAALLNGPLTPRAHLSVLALIGVAVVACITLSIGGAFADKNAERSEADIASKAQTVASEQTRAEKIAETPNEKLAATPTAATSAPSVPPQTLETPVKNAPYVYAGTVVDDAGKPVAGAKITLDHAWSSLPSEGLAALAVSDAAGHFQFSVPKRGATDVAKSWSIDAMLVATKVGYGLAGAPAVQFETTGRLAAEHQQRTGDPPKRGTNVLKLAPDDVPIRGRFLDTEGRPVAGAKVQVVDVWQGRDGSLLAWEKIAKTSQSPQQEAVRPLTDTKTTSGVRPPVTPPVRTDADGRFTLHGVGRDRLADVLVSSPRLATTLLHVRSRRGDVIKGLDHANLFYPCEFTRVLGPTTPVEGQIVDGASKQPIAGVLVRQQRLLDDSPNEGLPEQYLGARTNADGRYRLEGLPIGRNVLEIVPPGNSPFIPLWFLCPTHFSPAPAVANVTLAHGTHVYGRVTDVRTGRPVRGHVEYFAFTNNRALAGVVDPKRPGNLLNTGNHTDENGHFEIAVLPGSGIVAFRADHQDEFLWGEGADRITGKKWEDNDRFSTAPMECGPEFYHLLTPVDPAPGAESLVLNLTLRSMVTVTGKVCSPEGKTLRDYSMFDADGVPGPKTAWYREPDETFEIKVHSPTERHRLMFYDRAPNLAGFYELVGEPAGLLEIKLQPAGRFVGRLVDGSGKPLPEVTLVISTRVLHKENARTKTETTAIHRSQIHADDQGRFEVRGVIPGLSYSAEAIGLIEDSQHRRQPPGAIFKDMTADAGQTRNLGDLQIAPVEAKTVTNSPPRADKSAAEDVVHGRVFLPDGKPAAGATVLAQRRFWTTTVKRPPLAKTIADSQGRFALRVAKGVFDDGVGSSGGILWIAAEVASYGPTWQQWHAAKGTPKELELKLRPEVPIHGRIVDLEGKPLRDVRVTPLWQDTPQPNIDAWLDLVRSGSVQSFFTLGIGSELQTQGDKTGVATDADGRFTLRGFGADRIVHLTLDGPTIAYAEIDVIARAIKPVTANAGGQNTLSRVFGSDFNYQAAPTQAVVGTITDAVTGAPLAGVRIESRQIAGLPRAVDSVLRTMTDAQGQYRLIGLPKTNAGRRDDANMIAIVPNDDQPYFMINRVNVPAGPGFDPVTLDFKLTRGVWITGRVTDKSTGAAVPAYLMYLPSIQNQLAARLPEFKRSVSSIRDTERYRTRPDGTFRLVGLPGRGLVSAHAISPNYRQRIGASEIAGLTKDGRYPTLFGFEPLVPHAMKEINPAPETERVVCDMILDPGGSIRIALVDRQGKPANGCHFCYAQAAGGIVVGQCPEANIGMQGLAPGESRPFLAIQSDRHLGKVTRISYDGKAPKSLTVSLEPCATLKGRLVDADGGPFDHEVLSPRAVDGKGRELICPAVESDAEGRFQISNLPPGAEHYTIYTEGFGKALRIATVADNVVAAAGQTIDLGEIKLARAKATASLAKPPAARAAAKVAKDESGELNVVHGRVLLPDGKPGAGARVLALRNYFKQAIKHAPLEKTIAGKDGEFTIRIPKLTEDQIEIANGAANIAAELSGFGTQWESRAPRDDKSKDVVLRLIPEMPINGRVVDLEGKPVGGVRVILLWQQSPRQEFGAWLEGVKSGSQETFPRGPGRALQGYDDEGRPQIMTDQDGRFTLRGVGVDRVVNLAVRGESIAYGEIDVVTRRVKAFSRKEWKGTAEVFGPDFTYHALPTRPIVGTVRDADSGAPLAGIVVENRRGTVRAETDVAGRYLLVGMPKGHGRGDAIVAVPNQDRDPYFRSAAVEVPDTPGLGPLSIDFKLMRGIWISGHVTDKSSGAPALAQIFYRPTSANPNAARFEQLDPGGIAPVRYTKSDGSFRQLAMSGHGVVWARGMRYLYRWAGQDLKAMDAKTREAYTQLKALGLGGMNALREFDAKPGKENIACDLVLDPGGVIPLSIVDPAGKPVSQCIFVFNTMTYGSVAPFEMRGMEPNESRGVLFRSWATNLGKVQVLHYDGKTARHPVTVKLEPYGTVKGRLLDEEGLPLKFVNVGVVALGDNYVLPPWRNGGESQADGRFVLANIASGAEYYEIDADGFDEPIAKKLSIASGQTIDLGDIKRKRKETPVSSRKPDAPVKTAATRAK